MLCPGTDGRAVLGELSCGEDEGIISLFLTGTDVDGFIMQVPKVLVHPHVSCLILLMNTVSILWGLWNLMLAWGKTTFG